VILDSSMLRKLEKGSSSISRKMAISHCLSAVDGKQVQIK